MKKRVLPVIGVALLLLCTACNKERQCKCVATDGSDGGLLHIMVVDRAMSCESINEMAIEHKIVSEDGTQTLTRTEVRQVKCRDYDE